MKYCINCGKKIKAKLRFCPYCGTKQPKPKKKNYEVGKNGSKYVTDDNESSTMNSKRVRIALIVMACAVVLVAAIFGIYKIHEKAEMVDLPASQQNRKMSFNIGHGRHQYMHFYKDTLTSNDQNGFGVQKYNVIGVKYSNNGQTENINVKPTNNVARVQEFHLTSNSSGDYVTNTYGNESD